MRSFSRLLLLAVLAALLSGCGYNAIQQKDEQVKAGWAEVLNQYKRRADLIPNLVQTVEGYANQERQVLTDVTNARSRVGQINVNADDADSLKQFQQAQGELSGALSRLLVVTENYRTSSPTRASATCRRSWKAPRTASPWRVAATSRWCRTTTPSCASSRS